MLTFPIFQVGVDFERTSWRNGKMAWFEKASPEVLDGDACCMKNWVATHYMKVR